mmetsp:Transcript_15220/g.49597  ORF Transcript_15220/g.49597 Transcript_15220/m.49597 type:complete len:309 (+) Transcript_15220:680-1606(+)
MDLGDEVCAMCGVDQTTHNRVLFTNAPAKTRCGHRFCQSCVDRNLRRQSQFTCPTCGTLVRRTTLDERTMTEIEVDRDAAARKRVLSVHNRRKETFASKDEYDVYLEMVEDLVYDLSRGGPEAKKAEESLKKYHFEHANDVAKNASAKVEADRSKFLQIRESKFIKETAAQRARDKDRQWKLKKEAHSKHERAFKLGDRDDAPPPLEVRARAATTFTLPPLPAVVEIRQGADVVKGDDLKKRRSATGFDPYVAAKRRATADFLTALDKWHDKAAFNINDLDPYQPTVTILDTAPPLDLGLGGVPMSDD